MTHHIHLHPLGGAAGDMFVACLLDAFPELRGTVIAAAEAAAATPCRLVPHHDGTLTGSRFEVQTGGHPSGHVHADTPGHAHARWRDIRAGLVASSLPPPVTQHAVGIFTLLAEVEGHIHGVPAEDVTFHEVGATDSIADIVAAAAIIAAVAPARWSVAPLPLGGGTIHTAHGLMPVPAPATALLLQGFAVMDDGIAGERVTPTGAAILRYLDCAALTPVSGTLRRSGYGFGARRLAGVSNCLRALVFETEAAQEAPNHRELAVISFEVDDQSGEDLAIGLERVRAAPGVHDVVQMPAFGKKSRLAVHVQVLVRPDALEGAVAACFQQTTTIGLRTHLVQGRALTRRFAAADVDGTSVTVKLVERPHGCDDPGGGVTGKAEADHVEDAPSHAARMRKRHLAEQTALAADNDRS